MNSGLPSKAMHAAIEDALRALRHEPSDDEFLHSVRQHIKRARAALRLLRESIGESAYRRENLRLRDASRPLARVCDAMAVAQTLSGLRRRVSVRERQALQALWSRLAAEQSGAHRLLEKPLLDRIDRSLQVSARFAQRWQKKPAAHAAVCNELKRAYRKARTAAAAAKAKPVNETLHEARKQVKYLGRMLQILRPRLTGGGKVRRDALAIGRLLGNDHDLAVLQQMLAELSGAEFASGSMLSRRVQQRRIKLQREALRKAKRLYRHKTGQFARHIELE